MAGDYGKIEGVVTIATVGVQRQLVAITYRPQDIPDTDDGDGGLQQGRKVVGETVSAEDGSYEMQTPDFTDEVIIIALDNYGATWKPNSLYEVGERIRPTLGNETGYVYQCTIEGTSAPAEPNWWINDGGSDLGSVGTATFQAIEAWWPVAHAPIKPILVTGTDTIYPLEIDPYFDSVALLLHADGSVDDSGPAGLVPDTETAIANATDVVFGTFALDTSSGDLTYEIGETGLDLMGDYTFEVWIRPTSTPNGSALLSHHYTSSGVMPGVLGFNNTVGGNGGSKLWFGFYTGSTWHGTVSAYIPPNNVYTFIRLKVEGEAVKVWAGGTLVIDWTMTAARVAPTRALRIGHRWDDAASGSSRFQGNMDDVRLTNAARPETVDIPDGAFPDSRFAVGREPTILDPYFDFVAFLYQLDTDAIDTSSNVIAATLAGGAVVNDSLPHTGEGSLATLTSGDHLTTAVSEAAVIGLQDYTLEFHIAILAFADFTVLDNRFGSYGKNLIMYRKTGTSQLALYTNGIERQATGAMTTGQFYHIAIVRKAGTCRLFVGGFKVGSDFDASTLNYDGFQYRFMGRYTTPDVGVNGRMDSIRLTIGEGRYWDDFTPPAEAYPNFEYDPLENLLL